MGKFVAAYCSGNLSGYSDWFEEFELVVDATFSDLRVSDARSDDFVLCIASSSIVAFSVVVEKVRHGPNFQRSNFEFK